MGWVPEHASGGERIQQSGGRASPGPAAGRAVIAAEARARVAPWLGIAALALAGLVAAVTRIEIVGHWYGLFLLRGRTPVTLEVKDDLLLGDGDRLLAGLQLARLRALLGSPEPAAGQATLALEWDERQGSGIVRNRFADGTELVTLFSRFEDSQGEAPHGLYVGGALPDLAADPGAQNESGMAYRDARGWKHIWCNVNEASWFSGIPGTVYPSAWRFLGSRVLIQDPGRVVLESSHELLRGGTRIRMDRLASFQAGAPFFTLAIRVTNVGDRDVSFDYVYGDEPWVGEFGSADGNLGWDDAGIVREEGSIDVRRHRWAGIVDTKTGAADFLSWLGDEQPDVGYFSNTSGPPRSPGAPLDSNEIFIGVEWNKRSLRPGQARSMRLAVGMAVFGPKGEPRLPPGAEPDP